MPSSPSHSLQVTGISQKWASVLVWCPFLQLLPRGHSLITWLWWLAELTFIDFLKNREKVLNWILSHIVEHRDSRHERPVFQ